MANKIHLRIVTPSRLMFDEDIDMVVMRTMEGEIAFMSGHSPLTTTLDYGIMRIIVGAETKEASILGGFVEVSDNIVTVLSDIAEWPDEIDVARAEAAREKAQRDLQYTSDQIDMRRAELAFRRAVVRLDVSTFSIIKGRGTAN